MHVIVDPGHGGLDSGATQSQLREADIVLSISKKLYNLLKKNNDFKATLTRHKDEVVPLFERSKIAVQNGGEIFISIHANSSPDTGARGTEFYFQSQMPADEEVLFLANRENDDSFLLQGEDRKGELATIIDDIKKTKNIYSSQILAETIIESWKKVIPIRDQPIRQGPFHVLVNVPMPSVLIEIGFVTNIKDLKIMSSEKEQDIIARNIYNGIKDYKEKIDKSEFSRHIINHANR